jgi:WD40 repeat protein
LTSFHQLRELTGFHTGLLTALRVNHGTTLYAFYKDATVQVIDLQKNALLNQNSGHSCKVNSVRWLEKWSFASCSDEGFLYVWKYIGKGWNMKALDVSGRVDRSKVTSLAVHPNRAVVVCGFSAGSLKFFDLSTESPRFLQAVVLSVLPIVDLKFTASGNYLGVSYSSGQVLLLDSHSREVLLHIQEHLGTESLSQAVDFLEAVGADAPNSYYLKSLSLHSKSSISLQTLALWDRSVSLESSHVVEVPGRCTGFTFHVSGNYVFATTDSGFIYIFSSEGELRGAIEIERGATGCTLDPSGLYITVLLPDAAMNWSRLAFYETGTGRKATELARIEGCSSSQALEFSRDGRFLLVGGHLGTLSVWRLPGSLSKNILTMLENLQGNPQFWDTFPIDLPSSKIQPKQPEFAEMPTPGSEVEVRVVEEPEVRRSRGTFADSVVSFVKRPREEGRERELYPPVRPRPEEVRASDQEFWKVKPRQSLQLASGVYTSDPNFAKKPITAQQVPMQRPRAPVKPAVSKPTVIKANRRFAEPDNIDIHLEESVGGYSRHSQYDEVEEMYRDMDLFP